MPSCRIPQPALPAAQAAACCKMDLCIHNVRAYPDLQTSARANGMWVADRSGLLAWCKAELIGVERKVALMTAYGMRLSAWAAGIITTAVLIAPGYAQDTK